MIANAGFNVYCIIRYPEFEDAQRKDAQAEIQEFLAAHPQYASTMLSVGANFVAKNPRKFNMTS